MPPEDSLALWPRWLHFSKFIDPSADFGKSVRKELMILAKKLGSVLAYEAPRR